jgi:hypothetical protein
MRTVGVAVLMAVGLAAPAQANLRAEYQAKYAELVERHGVNEAGCNLLTDTKRWNRCKGKATSLGIRESIATLKRMLFVPPPPQPQVSPSVSAPAESVTEAGSVGGGATATTSSSWDAVAQCESSGNWSTNTGNGYYGGLQFDSQTWDAYGNPAYGEAHEAPASEQIAAAERLPYDGWPNC